jgi:hypothetical protein
MTITNASIEDTVNWTLGTAPGTLPIATWTITPSSCESTVTYDVVLPPTVNGFIDDWAANGDLNVKATDYNTDTALLAEHTITIAPVWRDYTFTGTLTTIDALIQTSVLTFTSPCELPGINVEPTAIA